jgi:hypothetical protein
MRIRTVVVYRTKKRQDRGGQQYELVAFMPYKRKRDGAEVELAIWQSHCRRCGEPFTCATASRDGEPRTTEFSRHCAAHRTRFNSSQGSR